MAGSDESSLGSCHFYQRKELEPSEEVESLKAHLQATKVGWYTEPSLPNDWKARRVLGEGKLVFRSPQMQILKSNKALLDYISNHEMSKEDVRKIRNFVDEDENNRKEGM